MEGILYLASEMHIPGRGTLYSGKVEAAARKCILKKQKEIIHSKF